MDHVRARAVVEPHSSNPATLQAQRQVYGRGQTPVRDRDGTVRALDMRPAGPETAGRHLDQIADRYGEPGLARSIQGLTAARGWSFAQLAVRHASASVQRHGSARAVTACIDPEAVTGEQPVFSAVAAAMRRSQGVEVPGQLRPRLPPAAGHSLADVRVHDDAGAHELTRMLGARAVTVGRSIYMGTGEYRPSTAGGRRLLAHELAHTIQQAGTAVPSAERMRVSGPGDAEEVEAESLADAVTADAAHVPMPRRGSASPAKLLRAIRFEASAEEPTTANPGVKENTATATFQIGRGYPTAPHFNWKTDVMIHGNAGDPFGNFQVGPLQVLRSWRFLVWWGSGANRTIRRGAVPRPIRDALTSGNTWYADVLASTTFGADRDIRSTSLRDSPGMPAIPIANPVAGRTSTQGNFSYAVAFVSYFSARDTTAAGAAAFQHLLHVPWDLSVFGTFDAARPAGSRVNVIAALTRAEPLGSGESPTDPPIIGGPVPNQSATVTDE
jgi:hypothetical protein